MPCKQCMCILLLVSCFQPALALREEYATHTEVVVGSKNGKATYGSIRQDSDDGRFGANVSASALFAGFDKIAEESQCGPPDEGQGVLRGLKLHCEEHLIKVRKAFSAPSLEKIWEESDINLDSATKGSGKSGAKLLFTKDKRYLVKTMTDADSKIMMAVMKNYRKHVVSYASTSLMMRVFGIVEDARGGKWIVANNWLPVKFHTMYDLKGSTSGRKSKEDSQDKKDVNWINEHMRSIIPSDDRERIVRSLKSDSLLLAESNLIDYSVIYAQSKYSLPQCGGWMTPSCIAPICDDTLGCGDAGYILDSNWKSVGSFYCQAGNPEPKPVGHTCLGTLFKSSKSSAIDMSFECFGIIDLLKFYGTKSAWERFFRAGYVRDVSVQPADVYKERFDKFMEETVFPISEKGSYAARVDITGESCRAWGTSSNMPSRWYSVAKVLLATSLILGLVGSVFICVFNAILSPTMSSKQFAATSQPLHNSALTTPSSEEFHAQGGNHQGQQYAAPTGNYGGQHYAQTHFYSRQQPSWPHHQ
eukprot:TRINITY_DN32236_c0_g1_i1.p1 TRINITY_DN32236_c0_g1~~TRINITY_DN32236_c0_g1_i1.p1  ORF type:complete len:531 (-),score=86.35 TRINITY_DN32236_c0_g1_i1:89-1681(-)